MNKLIKSVKIQYCKDNIEINKNNPKEMWKNINQVVRGRGRHAKTTAISSIKDNLENTIDDEKCIADQLNKYFVEIGPKLTNNLSARPRSFSEYLGQVDCEFQFGILNSDTVHKKLKPKKEAGLRRIPQKLVKDSGVSITPFLSHIFNTPFALH